MSIYKTAIEKPVTTSLIFVAVIIIGIFALTKLPIDQYPEMEPPYVSVMCTYPGNTGSEIETNLTKLLENSLNSIEGLDEMTSTSKDNIALVSMKFQWGQNMDETVNDVRSALDMVSDNLPVTKSVMSKDDPEISTVRIKLERIEGNEVTVVDIGDVERGAGLPLCGQYACGRRSVADCRSDDARRAVRVSGRVA